MLQMPTAEEFAALQAALAQASRRSEETAREHESLRGEIRVLRVERDLLKERLYKFMRKIFAAQSELSERHQNDMFFNEGEALGAAAQPSQEEVADSDDKTVDVPGHKRKVKRGRKPLDPALPREVVRHELSESERVCPHDGAALREIGVEASEQLDIIPQQVRVIRHERVKYACPCCDGTIRVAERPAQ